MPQPLLSTNTPAMTNTFALANGNVKSCNATWCCPTLVANNISIPNWMAGQNQCPNSQRKHLPNVFVCNRRVCNSLEHFGIHM